ncbi:piggyBac transposable element-derived protein 4 [Nephila pilipes]|uniref:PiggyBac transposable element-derived protein 4 n=1 Tax=Nephila pilipes TaxID=299642 RepID=A0A8X6UFA1_NEPPI|nr:piggyBac transposable element-derived protein 4 [Nephila pilipes]
MASSSLKRYIDDFDCSTENKNFEGFDTSDASEIEMNYIECINESADSGDDDIVNARDWCEITASGLSESPRFPSTGTPGVTFTININYIPLDILEMFLDSNLLHIIVKETTTMQNTKETKIGQRYQGDPEVKNGSLQMTEK